jgi:hypothetical protein
LNEKSIVTTSNIRVGLITFKVVVAVRQPFTLASAIMQEPMTPPVELIPLELMIQKRGSLQWANSFEFESAIYTLLAFAFCATSSTFPLLTLMA